MSLLTVRCTCCNSDLTAPTIINGKPYGYTCAAKIEGGKDARKFKYVPVKLVKTVGWSVILETEDGERIKKIKDGHGNIPFAYEQDGQIFIRRGR